MLKNIFLIILLCGTLIPVCNSAIVDNGQVTGVYEGNCGNFYDFKATLKGSKGDRVSGVLEFYPKPNNPDGSCGAFTVDGTLSYRMFGDDFLVLHSDSWLYYSGTKSIKKGASAKGQVKYDGPFKPDDYSGLIEGSLRVIEGCRVFAFERKSNKYPETLTLPNKKSCENGMIASTSPEAPDSLTTTSTHDILGLKLYMTPVEVEPILERLRSKDFTVSKFTKETFYLDPQQTYLDLIVVKKKGKDKDEIDITFFGPPHENTIASISRVREYKYDLDKAPYAEEVINYMVKKYGSPKIQSKKHSGISREMIPTVLWSDYKCLPIISPDGKIISKRSQNCGKYFGLSYDVENGDIHKDKVRGYILSLYDETEMRKNAAKIKALSIRYAEEKERLRIEEKNRRIQDSKFSDDI